jgi:Zn-dependent protease
MSMYDLGKRRRAVRPSPLFLVVVAVTAVGGVLAWLIDTPGSRLGDFGVCLLVLGGWVVTVCLHEFAHAYAAYRAGDRGVEARGYLTLNPFKYTHPVLSILLPLIAIMAGGFALPGGAVYLHRHQFRSRAGLSAAAAAGPAVNLVLGAVLVVLAKANGSDVLTPAIYSQHGRFWYGLAFLGFLQLTAAVLNLLPVPGLDGYAIVEPYLDPHTQEIGNKVKPWGMLVVIVLLFYANGVRNAFFDLVDYIYGWFGGTDTLWLVGHEFFRFWAKQPL